MQTNNWKLSAMNIMLKDRLVGTNKTKQVDLMGMQPKKKNERQERR